MEIDYCLLTFFVEEEGAVGGVVHEEVFGEDGGAGGVAEEVEVGFLVGVGVGVVRAEAVCREVFSRWLNTRLVYPDEAKTDDGTVLAKFTVGTDGKVKDITILWSVSEQLDGIVAQQIAKSPEWTPAMKDGKPVEMSFIQPVVFMVRTSSKTPSPVVLNIRKDGTIESGDKVYTLSQLKDIIPPHAAGQPYTTVTIMAADDVPMGVIDDVKMELRKLESMKVRYASASGKEGGSL